MINASTPSDDALAPDWDMYDTLCPMAAAPAALSHPQVPRCQQDGAGWCKGQQVQGGSLGQQIASSVPADLIELGGSAGGGGLGGLGAGVSV